MLGPLEAHVLRIKAFIFPISIFVLRNGPSYYKSIRASYAARKDGIKPVPPKVSRVLNVLFILAAVLLLRTLPYFTPDNIFAQTNGRLQTSTDVLFRRLSALRPLTPDDQALRAKLTSKDSRLIYFAFGPEPLLQCPYCSILEPESYRYYALPGILASHVLQMAILGLITSPFISGREGARWRSVACLSAVALAATDFWFTYTYNLRHNTRATQLKDIDFFFWRSRMYRLLAFASLDALLGWVLYLSSTRRFFVQPPSTAERLESMRRMQEAAVQKMWATGNIKNAVVRDRELRDAAANYWTTEKQIYEEREVVDSLNAALGRINVDALTEMADKQAEAVINSIPNIPTAGGAA